MPPTTNKDLLEAIQLISNSKQCQEHAKLLKEHSSKLENFIGFQAIVKGMEKSVKEMDRNVQKMHQKMFVSNGSLCFSEDLRTTKTNMEAIDKKIETHVGEHKQNKLSIGQKITIGSTIVLALIALAEVHLGKMKTDENLKQVKEAIKVIAKGSTP